MALITLTDEFIMLLLQSHRYSAYLPLVMSLSLLAGGCAEQRPPATDREPSSTLDDMLPLTAANLRGHKMLYDEGWFIVTSSRQALTYAKQHPSSLQRKDAFPRDASSTTDYAGNLYRCPARR